ncbi:isoprenyl transferase [Deferribacterales bacterium Es71-Z0220]|uniref:isoprenyl transferase n=1 Tax=Deferrivibrio essentukiensis TaxID=2880922 RepID=UPI001F603BF1|nr:isoprenyl transferase [Deferrivibrio essentukiensis]MCB4203932.1 isoprenyl transferase [Deferrivibrio essentukiensis]
MRKKLPKHIGIIMDGNGRWAKRRGLPRVFGHKEGVKAVKRIVSYAAERGIKYLSLFAFSTENWNRPKDEVSALMKLLNEYLQKEINELIEKGVSLRVSGRVDMLPDETRQKLLDAIELSKNNNKLVLNLCLSYGGRSEIIDAAKNAAMDVASGKLTLEDFESKFDNYLYNPDIPDIDLLIRTSGEQRISNFMLYRIAYSELYFTQTLWPGFYEDELDLAIDEYQTRQRRFGKTDEQVKGN